MIVQGATCEPSASCAPDFVPAEDDAGDTPCSDSAAWYKTNEPSKNCDWVSKYPEKRCRVKGYNKVLADYACAASCESESCLDDATWTKTGNPSKDCSWVSTFPTKRCKVKGDAGLAMDSCPTACSGEGDGSR